MIQESIANWEAFADLAFTDTNIIIVSSISAFMFVASLLLIPWFISRLPSNYFIVKRRPLRERIKKSNYGKAALLISKNVLGVFLLSAGILMLVLPGQGLLTILVGIILMDFPGKQSLECRILTTKGVKASADWLRKKYSKSPFQLP